MTRLLVALLVGCAAHEPPTEPEPVVAAPSPAVILQLDLPSAHTLPEGAPSVVARIGRGVGATPALVVYLHGWEGCAEAVLKAGSGPCFPGGPVVGGWGLSALHEAAPPSVLVVPQLAFVARSSSAGLFDDPDFAQSWWDGMTAELGQRGLTPGRTTLVAHSGGYRTLQALLAANLPGVERAVFLDGLYGGADEVADWVVADPHRVAVSVHTANRDTTNQSRRLAGLVGEALGDQTASIDPADPTAALATHRVVVVQTEVAHGAVPDEWLPAVFAWAASAPAVRSDAQ